MRRGYGEGSIRQIDGKFVGQVSCGTDDLGKRIRRTVTANTRQEVLKKMRQARDEMDAGVVRTKGSFRDLAEDWLDDVAPRLRPKTLEFYRGALNVHVLPRAGKVKTDRFSSVTADALLRDMRRAGVSGRTQQAAYQTMSSLFAWAEMKGLVSRNPMSRVTRPTHQKKALSVWSREDVTRFLDSLDGDSLAVLWRVALGTGARQGELLGLKWSEVDLEGGVLRVCGSLSGPTKTQASNRVLALPASVTEALRALPVTGEWVFGGTAPLNPRTVRIQWKKACERAGVPVIRFHDIRHTHATLLITSGTDIKTVSGRLGHASTAMTLDTYAKFVPAADRSAADRLETFL